jgi:DNA-binding IclR family transcriptional regulator
VRNAVNNNALAWATLIRALLEGDCTADELVEVTGLRRLTVYEYLRYLKKLGAVHVCAREPDVNGRLLIKVWRLGDGVDVRPPTQSKAVKNLKLRAKRMNALLRGIDG